MALPRSSDVQLGKDTMTDEMNSREDILITRVLEGEAQRNDLRDLFALAAEDATLWDRFQAARQDRDAFAMVVNEAVSVADRIESPLHASEGDLTSPARLRFAGWSGWAAAAAIVLAWSWFGQLPPPSPLPDGPTGAILAPASLSADDALAAYLDRSRAENRLIRELPQVFVEARPAADGHGTEVTYMRQFLERTVVNDIYELTTDEAGTPGAVRVSHPVNTRSALY